MIPRFRDCDTVAAFVGAFGGIDFGPCQAIGFEDADGQLVAGVVYHDWDPNRETIALSVASTSKRWMSRSVCRLIFDYPFEQIGCRLVWGRTDEPIIGRVFKALGGDGFVIPGLWTIVTLTDDQWRAWRDERLKHEITEGA